MKKKVSLDPNVRVINYLVLAQSDYVTGRHLLRAGFLEHGAMLAATAAEKYLKAVIGIHGLDNTDHLSGTLYKLVGRCQPELFSAVDKDFLKFLEKAFKLRYASASAPGFAIVINQYRTLFAIDKFVADVDRGFSVTSSNGVSEVTPYRASLKKADPLVVEDNIAVDPTLFMDILLRHNKVLDLKVENDCRTVSVLYETEGVNMAGSFTKIPEVSLNKSSFLLSRG